MSQPAPSAPTLSVAHGFLRLLIVLNWLMGLAILVLLIAMPHEKWILAAFKLSASPAADRVIIWLRVVAVIGLATIALNHGILQRLLEIASTVRAGDPFVAMNAQRLQTIARILLALQLVGLVVAMIGGEILPAGHPVRLGSVFSISGWLAVLCAFVLARVFAHGTRMREELEATV